MSFDVVYYPVNYWMQQDVASFNSLQKNVGSSLEQLINNYKN